MKFMRTGVTIVLLLFVGATVGTLIAQEVARPGSQPIAAIDEDSSTEASIMDANEQPSSDMVAPSVPFPVIDEGNGTVAEGPGTPEMAQPVIEDSGSEVLTEDGPCVVEAVYFHNTHRCVTCLKIEGDAKAIVEETFGTELAAGTLRWSTINMEDHPSLSVQYNLASPSLVLLRKKDNQVVEWILLEETWALVRSSTRYSAYIIESFSAFLEGCL